MGIQKDIKELVEKQIISVETAQEIRKFYQSKSDGSQNRLFTIFGILGALLVGLGVVLIIAHNWDNMSQAFKTFFAFLPLVIAQAILVFSKWKKPNELAWIEGSAVLVFFALGACISMISQIYHISGSVGDYLFTWMLLVLPLVYLMPSSIVAIFYLLGITYMGVEMGYFNDHQYEGTYKYWLMLAALVPYYYWMHKNRAESNFLNFLNWLMPLSVIICLGVFAEKNEEWMFVAYMCLFGLFYNIGSIQKWEDKSIGGNGFKFLGSIGMVIILLISSFREFWGEMERSNLDVESPEFLVFIILAMLTVLMAGFNYYKTKRLNPKAWIFLLFIPLFFLGLQSDWVVVIFNLAALAMGIQTIKEGIDEEHLGILNYGLLIISALIACRFFDSNLSFVVRGLLFILVGLGFFFVNYWMIKRRKDAA